jgi:GNAT superfamily N-acetyltransferase
MPLRDASAADYPAFARLYPELATPDALPSEALFAADYAPSTFVFDEEGKVLAYCYVQVLAEAGYVRHLVVAPEARGRGLGRSSMLAARDRFRAAGATTMHLNVDPTNTKAVRLYESLGLVRAYETEVVRFPWTLVDELSGPASDSSAHVLAVDELPLFERRFGLPEGLLRAQGMRTGRLVVGLVRANADEPGEPLGVAAFNPPFPGAFPFKVSEPARTRALLEALRPHRLPELGEMQLVIEDQPSVAALLVGAGARIVMRIVHMQGSL